MPIHYSQPKEFVGRSLHYAIYYEDTFFGCISWASCILLSKIRDSFFNIESRSQLVGIANNIFYHVEPVVKYPIRNFTTRVLLDSEEIVYKDWLDRYGDALIGYESLVEPPREGTLYKKAGYTLVGKTQGFQLKKPKQIKVYDTVNLKPKLVFCKRIIRE